MGYTVAGKTSTGRTKEVWQPTRRAAEVSMERLEGEGVEDLTITPDWYTLEESESEGEA